jgi:hypothetical protein
VLSIDCQGRGIYLPLYPVTIPNNILRPVPRP